MPNPTRSAEALASHLRVKMISEVLDDDDRLAVSLKKQRVEKPTLHGDDIEFSERLDRHKNSYYGTITLLICDKRWIDTL